MKKIILGLAMFAILASGQAQLFKKLKDKVNKTIGSDTKPSGEEASSSAAEKDHWCDTISGANGISYTKAYSGAGNIMYDESSLGLTNDPSGYRLILSQYAGGKTIYTIVENGKVIDTDTKVKPEYLGKGRQSGSSGGPGSNDEEMKKYIVADSTHHDIPKTSAKSMKVEKVDDDQVDMALNIMRQTDEYKNSSAAEKQEIEETVKKGISANNSMAGKTINIPASQGANFATVTGYKLIVNGKNYGKFLMPPAVAVSKDETSIFAVGLDDKGAPVMVTQTRRTALDKSKYSGNSGKMLKSADGRRSVYVEQRAMTQAELQRYSSGGSYTAMYNVLRSDGTGLQVSDYGGNGKFSLTSAGAIINVNETTGELYADNKKLGQFTLPSGERVEPDAVLIGSGPSNIAYYNGSAGSLNYLDGTVKKLGIMYPSIVSQNGTTYMSWFRKCRNDIYIGKLSY